MKLEIEVDEAYIAELVSQVCWRYKSRGHEPLFGHRSGKNMKTHWLAFMKMP